MTIRSFRLSDHVTINRLLEDVLPHKCYSETKTALARQLSWDSDLVLVAEEQDEIVGLIIGTIDHNSGFYYRLAVDPGYQRKGIGKSLIQALDVKFKQRDVTKIMVAVDEHNQTLLPFFDAVGVVERWLSAGRRALSIVG